MVFLNIKQLRAIAIIRVRVIEREKDDGEGSEREGRRGLLEWG